MDFYLGTHHPNWLARSTVPLFVSAIRLRRECRRRLPRALTKWRKDSGGFSVLNASGSWTGSDREYAEETLVHMERIGNLDAVAIRDWMCEPDVRAKTGKTIREHQELTIESLAALRHFAPEAPWMPVLQGWHLDDYLEHLDMYRAAGFDLAAERVVGVGSVCRRQGTREAAGIMTTLASRGIRIHAFGAKTCGLALYRDRISSADSLAWSYAARRQQIRLPGHTHLTCSSCLDFAMQWRDELLAGLGELDSPAQMVMPW